MLFRFLNIIKQGPCLSIFPNNEKEVENATRSRAFFINFELFGNVVKEDLEPV